MPDPLGRMPSIGSSEFCSFLPYYAILAMLDFSVTMLLKCKYYAQNYAHFHQKRRPVTKLGISVTLCQPCSAAVERIFSVR